MSANELALKYSSASAEQLIGFLSVLEVKEAIRSEVEDEVLADVWQEHEFELEAAEERVDEAEKDAEEHEDAANDFATAIRLALSLDFEDSKKVLNDVIEDNPGYGRDPQ